MRVQFDGVVTSPSKAAKLATGMSSEVNGLHMWKWNPKPGESYPLRKCYSLHKLRAAGVTLEASSSLADAEELVVAAGHAAAANDRREEPRVN